MEDLETAGDFGMMRSQLDLDTEYWEDEEGRYEESRWGFEGRIDVGIVCV